MIIVCNQQSFKSYRRQITVDQSLYFAGPFGWSAEFPAGVLSSSQASIQVTIASASLLKQGSSCPSLALTWLESSMQHFCTVVHSFGRTAARKNGISSSCQKIPLYSFFRLTKGLLALLCHKQGRPVLTPNSKWSHITYRTIHQTLCELLNKLKGNQYGSETKRKKKKEKGNQYELENLFTI